MREMVAVCKQRIESAFLRAICIPQPRVERIVVRQHAASVQGASLRNRGNLRMGRPRRDAWASNHVVNELLRTLHQPMQTPDGRWLIVTDMWNSDAGPM